MSSLPRPRQRPARRSRFRRLVVLAVGVLLGTVIFVLGVGLGQTLRDDDLPTGTRTSVRTLKPLPLPPVRETVTVTVTAGGP